LQKKGLDFLLYAHSHVDRRKQPTLTKAENVGSALGKSSVNPRERGKPSSREGKKLKAEGGRRHGTAF